MDTPWLFYFLTVGLNDVSLNSLAVSSTRAPHEVLAEKMAEDEFVYVTDQEVRQSVASYLKAASPSDPTTILELKCLRVMADAMFERVVGMKRSEVDDKVAEQMKSMGWEGVR